MRDILSVILILIGLAILLAGQLLIIWTRRRIVEIEKWHQQQLEEIERAWHDRLAAMQERIDHDGIR